MLPPSVISIGLRAVAVMMLLMAAFPAVAWGLAIKAWHTYASSPACDGARHSGCHYRISIGLEGWHGVIIRSRSRSADLPGLSVNAGGVDEFLEDWGGGSAFQKDDVTSAWGEIWDGNVTTVISSDGKHRMLTQYNPYVRIHQQFVNTVLVVGTAIAFFVASLAIPVFVRRRHHAEHDSEESPETDS